MAGTKAGGTQAALTNKKMYGADFYARIGAIGGKNSRGGGFASMPRHLVSEAGRKGGTISRRTKERA